MEVPIFEPSTWNMLRFSRERPSNQLSHCSSVSMVIYYHMGFYPLTLDQLHAKTLQSFQIMMSKHALDFKHVIVYLLPDVKSRELTQINFYASAERLLHFISQILQEGYLFSSLLTVGFEPSIHQKQSYSCPNATTLKIGKDQIQNVYTWT